MTYWNTGSVGADAYARMYEKWCAQGVQYTSDHFEGERARDKRDSSGRILLEAHSMQEVQSDGSQKEVWYVP